MADFVGDFKATLVTGDKLLKMQQATQPPEVLKDTIKGLAESLLTKACCLASVTAVQVEELHALVSSSILEPEQQAKLMQVLTSRCLAGAGSGDLCPRAANSTKQTVQLLTNPSAFMTNKDWAILNDKFQDMPQKAIIVCDRCRLLGLSHPSEATFKHLATMVARVHAPSATPDQLYCMVRELKAAFAARKGDQVGCSRLARFPDAPGHLPDGVLKSGYPEPEDPPANLQLDGLHPIFARCPLRLSNKAIASSSSSLPSTSQHLAVPPLQQDGVPPIIAALGGLLQQLTGQAGWQQQQQQQAGAPSLITFCPPQSHPGQLGGAMLGALAGAPSRHGSPTHTKSEFGSPGAGSELLSDESQGQLALVGAASGSGGGQLAIHGGASSDGGQLALQGAASGASNIGAGSSGSELSALLGAGPTGIAAPVAGGEKVAAAAASDDLVGKLLSLAAKPPPTEELEPAKKVRLLAKTCKTGVLKKPAAAMPMEDGGLLLGCLKCRGMPHCAYYLSGVHTSDCTSEHLSVCRLSLFASADRFTCMHVRGLDEGCAQCRNPAFKGKRGPECKPENLKKAMLVKTTAMKVVVKAMKHKKKAMKGKK